ncbi:MAG TPA: glycosyltransferase family 2 protein, partial [Clostridia bacterium]|nr:glycosyltransferase family 2 protein [Clostridia bacterium]
KAVVIIPAYHPTEQLCHMVQDLQASGFDKIIVVDDGSGKNSEPVFQKIKAMGCDLLTHAANRGKGRALKTAFEHFLNFYAKDYFGVITVDADGQHIPADILRMREALLTHPDTLVLGCRNFSGRDIPLRSRLGNRMFHFGVSFQISA